MRIASLVEVVRGRLLNSPSIGAIEGFSFSPETTRRGDCYFHDDGDETALYAALTNGAFAAVFNRPTRLADRETALIAVDDMNRALAGLARYLLIEQNTVVFSASPIEAEIAGAIVSDRRLLVDPDFKETIRVLSRRSAPLLLCSKSSSLFETAINSEPLRAEPIEVVKETLLETTIVYRGGRLTLALPSLFLSELSAAIAFAKRFGLRTRFNVPIALSRFNIYAIANGERLLIFDRAADEEEREALAFIRRVAPWAKIYAPKEVFDPKARFTCAYLNGFKPADVFAALPR
ncbi:MAG: hypothetical protein LBI57_00005, partial [Helicobacteraceae bacterium]|nr:hypothetical protein [Helicobacteraceae bacterium]